MNKKYCLGFLLFSLLASSCSKKEDPPPQAEVSTRKTITVIHGDPLNIIKGSTRDTKPFLTTQNFLNFNDYILTNLYAFTSRSDFDFNANEDIEDANGHETENVIEYLSKEPVYQFLEQDGFYKYSTAGQPNSYFGFKVQDEKLHLVNYTSEGETVPVEVLHYSLKNDLSAFSILLYSKDDEAIISFVFVKKDAYAETRKANPYYKYLFGEGILVGWQKNEVELNLCGINPVLAPTYEMAIG